MKPTYSAPKYFIIAFQCRHYTIPLKWNGTHCYVERGKLKFNSMNIDIELISRLFEMVYYWHPSPTRVAFCMHEGPVSKEAHNVS